MRIETYQDQAGEWRWRLRQSNGRITFESGEGYSNRGHLVRALRAFRQASLLGKHERAAARALQALALAQKKAAPVSRAS